MNENMAIAGTQSCQASSLWKTGDVQWEHKHR